MDRLWQVELACLDSKSFCLFTIVDSLNWGWSSAFSFLISRLCEVAIKIRTPWYKFNGVEDRNETYATIRCRCWSHSLSGTKMTRSKRIHQMGCSLPGPVESIHPSPINETAKINHNVLAAGRDCTFIPIARISVWDPFLSFSVSRWQDKFRRNSLASKIILHSRNKVNHYL